VTAGSEPRTPAAEIERAELSPELRPRLTAGLYRGTVEGQPWVWNPRGEDALAVLNGTSLAILDACDGQTPLGTIRKRLRLPKAAFDAAVKRHLRNGFITADGLPSRVFTPRSTEAPVRKLGFWMHVTNGCNFACPYCYIAKNGQPMEDAVAEQFADRIVASFGDSSVKQVEVKLAGGEPFLRFKWMKEYVPRVTRRVEEAGGKIRFAVLSNGALITPEVAEFLREHRMGISVSLDGVGDPHDRVRPSLGGKSTFASVVRGLDNLQAAGLRPYILCTIGDANLAGLPELARFILDRNLGFRISLERDLDNGGRIKASDEVVIDTLNRTYDEVERRLQPGMAPLVPGFRETHRLCDLSLRHPIRKACGAGESYAAVGLGGALSPCQAALHQPSAGKLDGERPLAAQVKDLVQFGGLRRDQPNNVCLSCEFRWACAGGCPLLQSKLHGHANAQSAYCHVFKAMIPRLLELNAKELLRRAEHARARQAALQTAASPRA
jgi:uncharacterized protein